MNLLSGTLILIASFILGASLSGVYAKKVKFLTDFLDFISYTEGQIDFYKTEIMPLIEGYANTNENEIGKFLKKKYFGNASEKGCLSEGEQVEEFIAAVSSMDTVSQKGAVSSMDTVSQKGYLNLVRKKTEKSLAAAEKNYSVKGGLIRKLIPLTGVAVFIILL